MELGQTSDPLDLIPGNPESVARAAGQMYDYGSLLTEAGQGLSRIDTTQGWSGAAADAFRQRFQGQPRAWLEAGTCFSDAARALDAYVPVLAWAQGQAGVAIQLWDHEDKKQAQATLDNARGEVASAASAASATVGRARDQAPPEPGFWSDIGSFFSGLGHDIEHLGADAVDALASLGNAMIHNPLADLGGVGGTALAGVSLLGEGTGLVLDATGVGTVAGAPLNALSAAGLATGTGMVMASAGDLASHAFGDDGAGPMSTGSSGDSADPRLTRGTQEYDEYISELSKDSAHGGQVSAKTIREAQVAVQAEADGQIPGPLTRTPLDAAGEDQGDFTDATGQQWEVKSSPDLQPSYGKVPGQPITPQSTETFTNMINKELAQGQKVLLDPDGMTPGRLADLQDIVASHPGWQGQVIWGS